MSGPFPSYPKPGQDPGINTDRPHYLYSTQASTRDGFSNQGAGDDRQGFNSTETRPPSSWNDALPSGHAEGFWNPGNNSTLGSGNVDTQSTPVPGAPAASAVQIRPKFVRFEDPWYSDAHTVLPMPIEEYPYGQDLNSSFPGYPQQHMGSRIDEQVEGMDQGAEFGPSEPDIHPSQLESMIDLLPQYPSFHSPSWDSHAKPVRDRFPQSYWTPSGSHSAHGNINQGPMLPQTTHVTQASKLDEGSLPRSSTEQPHRERASHVIRSDARKALNSTLEVPEVSARVSKPTASTRSRTRSLVKPSPTIPTEEGNNTFDLSMKRQPRKGRRSFTQPEKERMHNVRAAGACEMCRKKHRKCRRKVPSLYPESSSDRISQRSDDGPSTPGTVSGPGAPLPAPSSQESRPGLEMFDCRA